MLRTLAFSPLYGQPFFLTGTDPRFGWTGTRSHHNPALEILGTDFFIEAGQQINGLAEVFDIGAQTQDARAIGHNGNGVALVVERLC